MFFRPQSPWCVNASCHPLFLSSIHTHMKIHIYIYSMYMCMYICARACLCFCSLMSPCLRASVPSLPRKCEEHGWCVQRARSTGPASSFRMCFRIAQKRETASTTPLQSQEPSQCRLTLRSDSRCSTFFPERVQLSRLRRRSGSRTRSRRVMSTHTILASF